MSLKDLQKQENKPQSNLKATLVVPPNRIKQDESFDDDDDVKSGSNLPTYPRPKTSTAPNVNSGKELTPKERMLLNKLKKADEEAAKVGQIAKENYEERMMRDSFRREATIHATIQIRNPILTQKHADYDYQMRTNLPSNQTNGKQFYSESLSASTLGHSTTYYIEKPRELYEVQDLNDEDEGTILKTVQYSAKEYSPSDSYNQVVATRKIALPTNKSIENDARPIKPLKAKIESAFDEDGIPSDPQLTNEYYQNFDDFENDSSPERKPSTSTFSNMSTTRNSMSKTVAPIKRRVYTAGVVRRPINSRTNPASNQQSINSSKTSNKSLVASKTFSGGQPRTSHGARAEYEQLIDFMQNALLNDKTELTETFGDDSRTSVFGANARNTKIQNLRAQAMRRLGADGFQKCYTYLREQRLGPNNCERDENEIFEGLKQYTPNPSDCFLVEQLLFLEEMS